MARSVSRCRRFEKPLTRSASDLTQLSPKHSVRRTVLSGSVWQRLATDFVQVLSTRACWCTFLGFLYRGIRTMQQSLRSYAAKTFRLNAAIRAEKGVCLGAPRH